MTIDEMLREAEKSGLTGFTLWRTTDGEWQASTRRKGDKGFTVHTDTDPVSAVRRSFQDKFGEAQSAPPPAGSVFE